MLHQVFGDYGKGKSVFLVYQIYKLYREHGSELLKYCCDMIDRLNQSRETPLPYPEKPPIFANFKVKIKNPDGSVFEPYLIDGKDIGINHLNEDGKPPKKFKYKFFPPGSVIFLDEAQKDFNSKDKELKRDVLEFFETHRHNDLTIWLATQRGVLISKDIRGLCSDFIQILGIENEKSVFNNIISTKWTCRQFSDRFNFELYIASNENEGEFKEVTFEHQGDILSCYDSHEYRKLYIPPDGVNFNFG